MDSSLLIYTGIITTAFVISIPIYKIADVLKQMSLSSGGDASAARAINELAHIFREYTEISPVNVIDQVSFIEVLTNYGKRHLFKGLSVSNIPRLEGMTEDNFWQFVGFDGWDDSLVSCPADGCTALYLVWEDCERLKRWHFVKTGIYSYSMRIEDM